MNVFAHFLIGPPGSGKSTLAAELQACLPGAEVISTDTIRADLYGDEREQGHWEEIEAALLDQVAQVAAAGNSVIYDATNVRRPWRMTLLSHLRRRAPELEWCAWWLRTAPETCQRWNLQRQRQVPEAVIRRMEADLRRWRPDDAEGFVRVIALDPEAIPDLEAYCAEQLAGLPEKVQGSWVRQQTFLKDTTTLHRYSALADFDRLLHLLALLLHHPGLGNLQATYPEQLARLLGKSGPVQFEDAVDEIAAVLAAQVDPFYANPVALRADLDWLEEQAFFQALPHNRPLRLPEYEGPPLTRTHAWSMDLPFDRLLRIVRWLAQNPLAQTQERGPVLEQLTEQLLADRVLSLQTSALPSGKRRAARSPEDALRDLIRKDFELVLRPYGFLPAGRQRQGYYVGASLVEVPDLVELYSTVRSRSETLGDPLVHEVLGRIGDRLRQAGQSVEAWQPVRAIAHQPITAPALLPDHCLAQPEQARQLERLIRDRQQIELMQYQQSARHQTEMATAQALPTDWRVWPLQIIFNNIGWYLGYEVAAGPQKGLLTYRRLDRLFLGRILGPVQVPKDRRQSLNRLERLRETSAGLHLGQDPAQQRAWLSRDPQQRQSVQVTVELWFTENIYRFISEGSQRFPAAQVRMTYPKWWIRIPQFPRGLNPFGLRRQYSDSPTHPYRFQVDLPQWYIEDVDFRRWVFGFGPGVYIQGPQALRQKLFEHCQASLALYPAQET